MGALAVTLDEAQLDDLAERVASRLAARLGHRDDGADRWLDSAGAVEYLGLTSKHALHRLTSERAIPFSQDGPGARCYFRRCDLDAWREAKGRGPRA